MARTKRRQERPWDRMPGETGVAHSAFLSYLRLGPDRSFGKLSEQTGRSDTTISLWSATWGWVSRSEAYDSHTAAVEQAAIDKARAATAARWERRRLKQAETDYRAARKMIRRAHAMLDSPLTTEEEKDGKRVVVPAKWTFDTAGKLMKLGTDLAGSTIDIATSDAELDAFDPETATPDQARALIAKHSAKRKAVRDAIGG